MRGRGRGGRNGSGEQPGGEGEILECVQDVVEVGVGVWE